MNKVNNLLAFLVIIGGDGVMNSSPDYILEKGYKYLGESAMKSIEEKQNWQYGLDATNTARLETYKKLWYLTD